MYILANLPGISSKFEGKETDLEMKKSTPAAKSREESLIKEVNYSKFYLNKLAITSNLKDSSCIIIEYLIIFQISFRTRLHFLLISTHSKLAKLQTCEKYCSAALLAVQKQNFWHTDLKQSGRRSSHSFINRLQQQTRLYKLTTVNRLRWKMICQTRVLVKLLTMLRSGRESSCSSDRDELLELFAGSFFFVSGGLGFM